MVGREAFIPGSRVEPGVQGADNNILFPNFDRSGRLQLQDDDGQQNRVGDYPLRGFTHAVATLTGRATIEEFARQMQQPQTTFRLFRRMRLVVTDSRIVYIQDDRDGFPETAGQFRYPWLDVVGYRPKQSFLLEPEVSFTYWEKALDGSGDMWFHQVELVFEKSYDPSGLAYDLFQRGVADRMRREVPPTYRPEVEAQLGAPRLGPPPRGQFAEYVFAVSCPIQMPPDYELIWPEPSEPSS